MLNVSLGPTPEKGPAGIQDRLRGMAPWSRLGNPDPTGGSGLGGRGACDLSVASRLDFYTPALFHHQMQPPPRREWLLEGGPRQLRQTLKELGGWLLTNYPTAGQLVLPGEEVWAVHLYMFPTRLQVNPMGIQ